jgi:hypothetical protein
MDILSKSGRVKMDGRPVTIRRGFPETAADDVEIAAVVGEGTAVARQDKTGDGMCPQKGRSVDADVANFGRFDIDRSTGPTLQISEKTNLHSEAIR